MSLVFSLGLGINRPLSASGPSISFDSALSVDDDAAVSTVIATASVSGQDGPHTFTLTNNAGGQFSITTGGELRVAAALTAGFQSITISADNGVDDPVVTTRSVFVASDQSLSADDVSSASETSSPVLTQNFSLSASDVSSASEISSPSLSEAAALSASDVSSATETSEPSVSQEHSLTASDISSTSEVDAPTVTQAHDFTADDVSSTSNVGSPSLTEGGGGGDAYALELDASDASSLTLVGSNVSQWDDQSGNARHATQGVAANQPLYVAGTPSFVHLDDANDNMAVDFGGAFAGDIFHGTPRGVARYKINVPSGAWELTVNENFVIDGGEITGIRAVAGEASDPAVIEAEMQALGAGSNFAGVTSLLGWFLQRSDIVEIDARDWDTSLVTSALSAFRDCSNATKIDVLNWDVSNITTLQDAFNECSALTDLDVSLWNPISLTSLDGTFKGCSNLPTLAIGGWNVSNVENMSFMLGGCSSLTSLDLSAWTPASLTNLTATFIDCSGLTSLNVAGLVTSSVTKLFSTFNGCSILPSLDVSSWDTSNVNNFKSMFRNCASLTSIDLSNFVTTSATSWEQGFENCSNLTSVVLSGGTGNPFADSPCTNYGSAFSGTNLTQQSIDDILVAINGANTSNGTFDQTGGSAPSTTGEAAVTALRGRGWTVNVTGGF